jgi:hypothetical protein
LQKNFEFWVRGFVENLPIFPELLFELGGPNLRVRRTLETERRELYRAEMKDPDHSFITAIDCQSSVIETACQTSTPLGDSPEYREATMRMNSVLMAVALCFGSFVKMREIHSALGGLPQIPEDSQFAKNIAPMWSHFLPEWYKFSRFQIIDFQKYSQFKGFWARYIGLQKPRFLEASLARFALATDSAGESGKGIYQFVDYLTSLEALLLSHEVEASYKLALRMAILLGGSDEDRQNIYDFMRESYGLRSELVHGRPVKPLRVNRGDAKIDISFEEALGRLHWYTRRCIRRTIDLLYEVSHDESTSKEWAKKGERKKKQWLTDLLDYAIVRSAQKNAVDGFFAGATRFNELEKKYQETLKTTFFPTLLDESNSKGRQGIDMRNEQ